MMNYTELKRGDVITIIDEYDITRIIIVNKVIGNHRLYTYVELDDVGGVYFKKYKPGVYHDLNNCVCRNAEDKEKDMLYNAIYKHFTEEYDKDWYNHFTDSSYFDIEDYLLDVFCVNFEEYDDDLIYPDFINKIHRYIWNKLCDVMGVTDTDVNEPEMVSLEDVCNFLSEHLYTGTSTDDYDYGQEYIYSDFDNVSDLIFALRKEMEK